MIVELAWVISTITPAVLSDEYLLLEGPKSDFVCHCALSTFDGFVEIVATVDLLDKLFIFAFLVILS